MVLNVLKRELTMLGGRLSFRVGVPPIPSGYFLTRLPRGQSWEQRGELFGDGCSRRDINLG